MVTTIADPAGHELAVGGSDDGGLWMKARPLARLARRCQSTAEWNRPLNVAIGKKLIWPNLAASH